MGLFHFPFNELLGWALNNMVMAMVILCFVLPTFIVDLASLPCLYPVPQISTWVGFFFPWGFFPITIGTFFF